MSIIIKGGSTALPSPVSIQTSDEIIWSANTGRSASGLMLGDVIAEKQTFAIEWGVLTKAEKDLIKTTLEAGFHPFSITIDGTTDTITSYRGTLVSNILGTFGGVTYYKDVSVTVIQQ